MFKAPCAIILSISVSVSQIFLDDFCRFPFLLKTCCLVKTTKDSHRLPVTQQTSNTGNVTFEHFIVCRLLFSFVFTVEASPTISEVELY